MDELVERHRRACAEFARVRAPCAAEPLVRADPVSAVERARPRRARDRLPRSADPSAAGTPRAVGLATERRNDGMQRWRHSSTCSRRPKAASSPNRCSPRSARTCSCTRADLARATGAWSDLDPELCGEIYEIARGYELNRDGVTFAAPFDAGADADPATRLSAWYGRDPRFVPVVPRQYRAVMFDSARWDDFEFRADDIVICSPAKAGTTWTQMLCALLIFRTDQFDAPLTEISPWIDMFTATRDDVFARLAAQSHRRFIKTHTPLDGIAFPPEVTRICVARDHARAAAPRGQPQVPHTLTLLASAHSSRSHARELHFAPETHARLLPSSAAFHASSPTPSGRCRARSELATCRQWRPDFASAQPRAQAAAWAGVRSDE